MPSPSSESRYIVITPFEIASFVIANPVGVKQSSDTVGKIASSGKEHPPRNDKCDSEQGEGRVGSTLRLEIKR